VIEGTKSEEKWRERCRLQCFEHESCRVWVAGKSHSIDAQEHSISYEKGSFLYRCFMFAAVHSNPIPLTGNIVPGTIFYAGSQICNCSDLPDQDHCNVFWTRCRYGISAKTEEHICSAIIKEPIVLACKGLPFLSVPLNEY
jgi:hypothetical protein